MNAKRFLALALAASGFVLSPASARADDIFSLLFPVEAAPGVDIPAIRMNLLTGELSSADIDMSLVTLDPVSQTSVPIYSLQTPALPPPGDVPLFSLFHMPPVANTFVFSDATSLYATYGAGQFSLALPTGTATDPLFPWLTADFTSMTMAVDLVAGTGVLFGDAVFSGFSFDASGLANPGKFVFALGGQQFLEQLSLLQYTIDPGAVTGSVPEPATLGLLALGLGTLAGGRTRIRRRRR